MSAGLDAGQLSEREGQVARRYVDGLSYKEIARDLAIAPATVRTHLNTIYRKLEVSSRTELLRRLAGDAAPPPTQEAAPERRQLTMMFVDLVGSTALAARLDPEDMHELLRAYREAVRGEVEGLGGHVAGFPGDGVVACFGWPKALEDAAERAVRAGLAVLGAVAALRAPGGQPLAARVGIATGVVVVDDVRGSAEGLTGGTPNLAARLQGAAEPGTVVIAASTRELVGELFDSESLGERGIKGLPEPVPMFRVTGERTGITRFDARHAASLPPMVGRDPELTLLLDRWGRALAGEGQAVLLTGEPGIGKSRLAAALAEAVTLDGGVVLTYQASPQQGDSPLWPVRRQLMAAARLAEATDDADRLHRLDALLRRAVPQPGDALPLLADLLDIAVEGPRPSLSAARKRERTLAALLGQLLGLAVSAPVLVLFEDVHWIDPTTLELLQRSIERIGDVRVLMLLTSRPDNGPPLPAVAHLTRLTLSRLGRAAAAAIVGRVAGAGRLGEELSSIILARTDGVPLFLEELTKAVLEAGAEAMAVPTSLQDSLMARLDRLDRVKEVAQLAACIGREFDPELLTAVTGKRVAELAGAIDRLVSAELLFRRGSRYVFKHALVQDAAYQSLLRGRRAELHGRIAEALLGRFPALVADEPESLAHHLAEAGRREAAIDYYLRAADSANNRGANREARSYLDKALMLNAGLPAGRERDRREVTILTMLGRVLVASEGHASEATAEVYGRALRLCEAASLGMAAFPLILGLTVQAAVSGEQHKALALARRLRALADTVDDPVVRVNACYALGITHAWRGEHVEACEQLEQGGKLYDPDQHARHLALYGQDQGVVCGCRGAMERWFLGYPDRAVREMEKTRRLAQRLGHPFSSNYALCWTAWLALELGERAPAERAVAASYDYAQEQSFATWRVWGLSHGARLMLEHGEPGQAAFELGRALEQNRYVGLGTVVPFILAQLGRALCRLARPDAGLERIEEALRLIESGGTRWPEVEVLRARAQCQVAIGDGAAAETTLLRALAVAERQQARMFGLRAARDLARLWAGRGERRRAHDLLAPLCAWFTEGLETRDLREAKALLDALA